MRSTHVLDGERGSVSELGHLRAFVPPLIMLTTRRVRVSLVVDQEETVSFRGGGATGAAADGCSAMTTAGRTLPASKSALCSCCNPQSAARTAVASAARLQRQCKLHYV